MGKLVASLIANLWVGQQPLDKIGKRIDSCPILVTKLLPTMKQSQYAGPEAILDLG
jgi:hypothetical protein